MARSVVLAVNDPNILYLLQRYVEESGLQTVIAGRDGDLADAAARSVAALVIVEDGSGMDETGALRALRERPETRRTPVLLYGSHGRQAPGDETARGPDAATGYLQECVMYDQFLAALRQVGVRLPAARQSREVART